MRAPFIWARQGEVSMTMGILPPSEALTRDCSSCWPMWEAAPLKPLLLNIIPQQLLLSPCTCKAAVRTPFLQLRAAAYNIKVANTLPTAAQHIPAENTLNAVTSSCSNTGQQLCMVRDQSNNEHTLSKSTTMF